MQFYGYWRTDPDNYRGIIGSSRKWNINFIDFQFRATVDAHSPGGKRSV